MLEELRARGELSLELRRSLANEAFATTAAYDAAIARWFGETEAFPDQLTLSFQKVADLRYGENPHQRGAYYRELGARRHLLSHVDQLGGRELSYNNLADLEAARRLARQFAGPAAVVVKHANPCGVAMRRDDRARVRARARRRPGLGVRLRARPQPAGLGRARRARISEQFVEVLLAPGFDDEALEALRAKPALRILRDRERRVETPSELDYRRVLGGLLVQERDVESGEREPIERRRGRGRRRAAARPRSSPGRCAST